MQNWFQDVRFAVRQLWKHRGFSSVAMLTLAIGIAAATAVFSLVDAVLLRPLPFPEPDRVVSVDTVLRDTGSQIKYENYSSWPDFFDMRREQRSLEAVSAYHVSNVSLGRPGAALRRVSGTMLSAGMAKVFGIRMQVGRDFLPAEELAGNRSVILTDALWHSEFAGRPDVIGRQIALDEESYTVVGVLPRSFAFPGMEESLFWVTEARDAEGKQPLTQGRGSHMLKTVGRLRDGVSLSEARVDLDRVQHALAQQFPETDQQNDHMAVEPLARTLTGDVRQPMRILLGAVGFLLLIACVNVAGLLLTRAVARSGELAIRSSLGASRSALLRQLLLEAVALGLGGGLVGTVLAAAALAAAPHYLPKSLPHAADVALNGRVLLFALLASVGTGLLFGTLPAWRASRQQPASALRGMARGSTAGRGRHRLHGGLVIAETALSMLLLVGAGLLLRSFQRVLTVDPGFQTEGLLSFRVAVPGKHFTDEQQVQFADRLQSLLALVPGVASATYGYPLPLAGGNMRIGFGLKGYVGSTPGEVPIARLSTIAPNFFAAMKIPILSGRTFTTGESQPNGPGAVVVNEAFARRFFPGPDPVHGALNKEIRTAMRGAADAQADRQVVGVVANTKRLDLTEATEPEYYLPLAGNVFTTPVFAVRTSGDPMRLAGVIRQTVGSVDPALPVFNMYPYDALLQRSTALRRFQTILITGFAAVALLLAAIGLYASLSYMVVERTPELGLRMALGSQRTGVLALVLRRGLLLAAAGLGVGLVAAAALTRTMGSVLYRTGALDALTYGVTTVILFAVCALSSALPALRASRLNPIETLRQQ